MFPTFSSAKTIGNLLFNVAFLLHYSHLHTESFASTKKSMNWHFWIWFFKRQKWKVFCGPNTIKMLSLEHDTGSLSWWIKEMFFQQTRRSSLCIRRCVEHACILTSTILQYYSVVSCWKEVLVTHLKLCASPTTTTKEPQNEREPSSSPKGNDRESEDGKVITYSKSTVDFYYVISKSMCTLNLFLDPIAKNCALKKRSYNLPSQAK